MIRRQEAIMITHDNNSILNQIINVSETIEGSKLEDKVLESVRPNLLKVSKYIDCDEISTIFFIIIFVIQNQRQESVTMHNIAEFLDYSFLHILEYRSKLLLLEKKGLIFMNERNSISSHPENNGYGINDTVMNNVIEGEPVVFYEQEEITTESILEEIQFIMGEFKYHKIFFPEYKRQIMNFEKKNCENKIIKSITSLFPDDFDSRIILYYFCFVTVNQEEPFSTRENGAIKESIVYRFVSPKNRISRRMSLNDETDILFKENLLERVYGESENVNYDEASGTKISFKLTPDGIKKIFNDEAKLYLNTDSVLTDTEKTINALHEFGYEFESTNRRRILKLGTLKRIEEKYLNLPFFQKISSQIAEATHRFFLYDVAKDFLSGGRSSLCTTLGDIYGRLPMYFTELRNLLDEKHELIEKGFIEVEKENVIERSSVTITDKTIEILYEENADLYTKSKVGKDIIEFEKIKQKELYYSPEVQKQIDMLEESLTQQNLEAMQNRLSEKGLPKGITVILYGAPGTGKTETVYQLAKKTNRKILHVDISESKSMWFGESEKKIKKIFTDYKSLCKSCKNHNQNTPILLFNEADAIISKRRDVDSDGCAPTENAMQNILLEEMEKLEGIMIATTNLNDNMDKAFERRFLFKVKYEKPDETARKKIWTNKLTCLDEAYTEKLALEFDFSGGEIDNIIRKCEMTEIIKGIKPSYEEIVEMCRTERLEREEAHRMGFAL